MTATNTDQELLNRLELGQLALIAKAVGMAPGDLYLRLVEQAGRSGAASAATT